MPTLPVFSVVAQAMAVFGLHIGKLLRWTLVPVFLCLAVAGLALLLAAYGKGLLHGAGSSRLWWIALVPGALFGLWAWTPYAVRINRLAVLGRVEPGGYMAQLVSDRCRTFLGYILLTTLIQTAGLGLSAAPFLAAVARAQEGSGLVVAGGAVSCALALAFLVLVAPLNLIFPAAALDARPSLRAAFNLGHGARWRLFWCMFLPSLLFGILGEFLGEVSNAFGADKTVWAFLVFMPAQVLATFFNTVTSTAVPAVAYRILSGLPDPRQAQDQDRTPDPRQAHPGGVSDQQ